MKLSTQYTLTLIFTGLMAVILLSINIIMYNMSSSYRQNNFYRNLEDRAKTLAIAYQNQEFDEKVRELNKYDIHRIYDAEDRVIELNLEEPLTLPELNEPTNNKFFSQIHSNGYAWLRRSEKSFAGVMYHDKIHNREYIVISSSIDIKGNAYRQKLKLVLAVAFLVAIVSMAFTSVVYSRKLFNPILRMLNSVNRISGVNLKNKKSEINDIGEVEDLKDTLNDVLVQIESAFSEQQKFIGNTTHSLRTPLTIISGETEIAMAITDPKHKAYFSLEIIAQETEKLNLMVSTLLEMAKLKPAKERGHRQYVRIDKLIHSVTSHIARMDSNYILKVDFHKDVKTSGILTIKGNETLLNLALGNVVFNAFKYSDHKKVKIKCSIKDNEVQIRVIDRGIGIPESDIDKVFVSYFRASNTDERDGFGIGLPLAMDIIRLHSGEIHVDSKPGLGTVFTIALPLAQEGKV